MIIKARSIGEIMNTQIGPLKVKDTKLYINPGGPFIRYLLEDALDALVRDMHARVDKHFDNFVAIIGPEGSGKSHDAADIIQRFAPNTDPVSHLFYSAKALRAHLRKDGRPGQIFWLDELYEMANNRNWNDPDTKWLVNLLVRGRNRGWTFIGCIPREKDADEYIRNHRTTHVLICEAQDFEHSPWKDRGYCEIQKRNIHGALQHIGYAEYAAMPEDVAARYEKAKWADQDELLGAPEKETANTYRERYEKQVAKLSAAVLMLRDAGVDRDTICSKLGITVPTYYRMCQNAKNTDVEVIDDDDTR